MLAPNQFVDVKEDLNLDENLIEKQFQKRQKLLCRPLTGKVCNMSKINKIAKKHKVACNRGCCSSHGSYFKNKHAGTFGSISAFSTHPLKNQRC